MPDDTRCLRFSAGVYNVGDGPMHVAFLDDVAIQHVYRRDDTPLDHTDNEGRGDFEEKLAGRASGTRSTSIATCPSSSCTSCSPSPTRTGR